MSLMELLTLLAVFLSLLSLIVDIVRLTVEVMDKFSQCRSDENKKDWPPQRPTRAVTR